MPEANAPLELTGTESQTVGKLAFAMKGVAGILLLLAGVNVVLGELALLGGSFFGAIVHYRRAANRPFGPDNAVMLFGCSVHGPDQIHQHPPGECF